MNWSGSKPVFSKFALATCTGLDNGARRSRETCLFKSGRPDFWNVPQP